MEWTGDLSGALNVKFVWYELMILIQSPTDSLSYFWLHIINSLDSELSIYQIAYLYYRKTVKLDEMTCSQTCGDLVLTWNKETIVLSWSQRVKSVIIFELENIFTWFPSISNFTLKFAHTERHRDFLLNTYYRAQTEFREGNVFTRFCQSFYLQGGLPSHNATGKPDPSHTEGRPPPQDTVNRRAVRILLECILVSNMKLH